MSQASASFERLDYGLRSNKNIERKLVFDILCTAGQSIGFSNYRYLGFGSMWFSDFRIAHRTLGIDHMISLERKTHAPRAEFNKPFAGITIFPGDALDTVREFSDAEWRSPFVAWFDFDGNLDDDVANLLKLFVKNCALDSVFAITLNARKANYGRQRTCDRRNETSVGVVETTLTPGVTSARFQPKQTGGGKFLDVTEHEFPEFLASAVLAYLSHLVVSKERKAQGDAGVFVPLINLFHRDGVEMITVGGAISSARNEEHWWRCVRDHPAIDRDTEGKPMFQRLDLVPITLREKLVLDRCLPESAEKNFCDALETAGICLGKEEALKYRRYYRHFPVFVESSL